MEAESCTDVHCNNLSHIDAIDNLYCDLITSLKSAARDSADTANKNSRGMPNIIQYNTNTNMFIFQSHGTLYH